MTNGPPDPRWPKLLSLSVHELRTPMTVVSGYIRMLLKDRAGPITDQQRKLLDEAEKACVRLSALLGEMSDLGNLEAGSATINRSAVDLRGLLAEAIAARPPVPDREVALSLDAADGLPAVQGDAVRLKAAFGALLAGLQRELVTSAELFVRMRPRAHAGQPGIWTAIGDADHVETFLAADASALATFDEWRGGVGLSLAIARRVIAAHGGHAWSPGDGTRAGAIVWLPSA